jgi:hypothetical protein
MEEGTRNPWLEKSRNALSTSTSFTDSNYRTQWENNIRAFQSKHHAASKYNTAQYRYRSKVFRPKTRAAIRNNEAAASAAFFTNNDVVSLTAANPSDKFQQASAEIMQELIQYRLTKTIPWYVTLLGGFQDASVIGVVASYQSWKYKEKEVSQLVNTGLPGEYETIKARKVVEDRPDIEIIPVENIRIHPAADWRDPVNSSPYLLRLIPMYVIDVKARMDDDDPKTGKKKWIKLEDSEIRSGTKINFDPTRLTREDGREDKLDNSTTSNTVLSDFDIVWVIENFMRGDNGDDFVFYTLGSEYLLSKPVPIEEEYFTGERPIVMGAAVIETHKIFPSSPTQLGENIQREINEVTNSRLDNVKLVLNKRYFVRRGSQTDLRSITRNVAASVTFVSDVEKDVKPIDFNDVTRSSYEEQNRLAVEYDELVGNFSQSSISSNRQLNETVGGMQMLKAGVHSLTEYLIRTFSETWVKNVMWQLVKLEQKYETDMVILSLAAESAKLFQKYGIDEVTDELLNQELTLDVNVGLGATDPITKLNQFLLAMTHLTNILRNPPPNLNIEEVEKEIFGRLGHKDASRFFIKPDEMTRQEQQLMDQIQQQQQIIEELKAVLDKNTADNMTKLQIASMKEEGANIRKEAELETNVTLEQIKLLNPVQGEKKVG